MLRSRNRSLIKLQRWVQSKKSYQRKTRVWKFKLTLSKKTRKKSSIRFRKSTKKQMSRWRQSTKISSKSKRKSKRRSIISTNKTKTLKPKLMMEAKLFRISKKISKSRMSPRIKNSMNSKNSIHLTSKIWNWRMRHMVAVSKTYRKATSPRKNLTKLRTQIWRKESKICKTMIRSSRTNWLKTNNN